METTDLILRLGIAALAGIIIGLNRDLKDKPIGMRTLSLVSLGAAVVTVSTIDFRGLGGQSDALSRVVQGLIQGIMGGISFIGAGVILRDRRGGNVYGLTTAATVWVAAALGIGCGLGAWRVVGLAVVITLVVLIGIRWVERRTLGSLD